MHGDQSISTTDFAFVVLVFIFRNAHPYQSADYPAGSPTDSCAPEGRHNRTGRHEWTYTRNRQRSNTGQPAEHRAHPHSRNTAGSCAFGQLRVLLVGEIPRTGSVGQKNGNVVAGKSRRPQAIDYGLRLGATLRNTINSVFHSISNEFV